jgi:hypothetical protein
MIFIGLAVATLLLGSVLWLVPWIAIVGQVIVIFISMPLFLLAVTPRYYLERIFSLLVFSPRGTTFKYLSSKSRRRLVRDVVYHDQFAHNMAFLQLGLLALVGIFGILQTEWFVSLLPRPTVEEIRQHINASRALQKQIADKYRVQIGREPDNSIALSPLFTELQQRELQEAIAFLLRDESLQIDLKNNFGLSFGDVNAVIVPGWAISYENVDLIGITLEGWRAAQSASTDTQGFTLRDRPGLPQSTVEGRPIIVLNYWAFRSNDTLRLSLFHEMLHAMNVPGYYPSRLAFTRNDLDYLPQYRDFVSRSGLEGKRDYIIWIVLVLMPWSLFLLLIVRVYRGSKSVSVGLQLQEGKTADSVKDSFPS